MGPSTPSSQDPLGPADRPSWPPEWWWPTPRRDWLAWVMAAFLGFCCLGAIAVYLVTQGNAH